MRLMFGRIRGGLMLVMEQEQEQEQEQLITAATEQTLESSMNSLRKWMSRGGSLQRWQKRTNGLYPYFDAKAAKADGLQVGVFVWVAFVIGLVGVYFVPLFRPKPPSEIDLILTQSAATRAAPVVALAVSPAATFTPVSMSAASSASLVLPVATVTPSLVVTSSAALYLPTETTLPGEISTSPGKVYLESFEQATVIPTAVLVWADVVKDYQNLRSCAGFHCDVVATVPRGSRLQVVAGPVGDWVAVVHRGRVVWLSWKIAWLSDYSITTQ